MAGIFSAIAGRQKVFYADKRTEEFCPQLPPGIVLYGEKWVQSQPIGSSAYHSCFIKGKFDAVVKFDDGSYGVIDFKTASPSDEKAEMYGRQLHAYSYALENPSDGALHLTPISKLGLIFFEPDIFEQQSLERQIFSGRVVWIEVARNDEAFRGFISEVMQVLVMETPPKASSDCAWCQYRDKMKNFDYSKATLLSSQIISSDSPLCPKCNGLMTLKKGKFGEFWSCKKYPECKGTKNIVTC